MNSIQDDSLIIRTWHEITINAIQARATDIHIEAGSQETLVRIRVDGLLELLSRYPAAIHERLLTRIKILARLDIAEKRLPQDGRLAVGLDFSKPNIDCRVSILPTLYGEKAVVRILPNKMDDLSLDRLGLLPEQLAILRSAIHQTNGLILVTGPTGSGKTRTLYSCLKELNQIERNLCSIEDPIEIRLTGINQVAYHPRAGLDFSSIIRALLRQDPDVIMIGEIRDATTAQLAIQAAQTGHLVLSTLHTRNAQGVLARLKSLGIDQEAINSCLHCVSSQRLVRMICQHCVNDMNNTTCQFCKGTRHFGRIGVHEVFNTAMLETLSPNHLNMHVAGMLHVKAGLIEESSLISELGSWR